MDEFSPHIAPPERKFSVVRYIDQWPLGRVRTILAEHMTFEEAVEFAQGEIDGIESQGLVILDSSNPGWEYDFKPLPPGP